MTEELSIRQRFKTLSRVVQYRPTLALGIIVLSLFTAVLEGIGLSFLLPIIELARDDKSSQDADGMFEVFVDVYSALGIPLNLESVVIGVAIVMTVRYMASFFVAWFRTLLRADYVRYLQTRAFNSALDTEISYFDQRGSDDILNAIVTQAKYAGSLIQNATSFVEQGLLSLMYLSIALYLAPVLTVAAAVILGSLAYLLRYSLESGYAVGDRVAEANERLQEAVQAGMQGIRDVKLFGMTDELFADFKSAVDKTTNSQVKLGRNKAALDKFYQLLTAVSVFVLIYAALKFFSLSLSSLGVFLFAMFRLAPRMSTLNNLVYNMEGHLPHVIRTQDFIDELEDRREQTGGGVSVPETIENISFDDVSFAYDTGETIFDGLSLSFQRGEFVAFVGPSGAGKSTIVSLLTRMYEPACGEIRANETPIERFDVEAWRSRISVVRQHPFIFNDTLRRNVTIGNRSATEDEIERVCKIAQVTEFLDDLPNGYKTVLGDDGVRLSGGQKQRVALARALLKDADFLVLDEATSDLDSNIEDTVHQAIESMERKYGMLVIAHRLSTVVNADRIYTIRGGEVIETGTHDELVAADGTYAELYSTQSDIQ